MNTPEYLPTEFKDIEPVEYILGRMIVQSKEAIDGFKILSLGDGQDPVFHILGMRQIIADQIQRALSECTGRRMNPRYRSVIRCAEICLTRLESFANVPLRQAVGEAILIQCCNFVVAAHRLMDLSNSPSVRSDILREYVNGS